MSTPATEMTPQARTRELAALFKKPNLSTVERARLIELSQARTAAWAAGRFARRIA